MEALQSRIDAELEAASFVHLHHFLDEASCDALMREVDTFSERHYTKENVKSHAAYLSDDNRGRSSFAFALQHPLRPAEASLPSIALFNQAQTISQNSLPNDKMEEGESKTKEEEFPILQKVTRAVLEAIRLEGGRTLFNLQKYWSHSLPVLMHRDGEVYDAEASIDEKGRHRVVRALYPKRVALLTLFNHADKGGTRLTFKDGKSIVVTAQRGDLVVFDNVGTEHGVDELVPLAGHDQDAKEVIRQIIGWRAMEWDCYYLNKNLLYEPFKSVSFGKATELQRTFVELRWPKKLGELSLLHKMPDKEK